MRTGYLVVGFILLSSSAALAQRRGGLQQYNGPDPGSGPMTAAEQKSAMRKAAGLGDVRYYGQANEPKKDDFPWGALGLAGVSILLISPFAWQYYKGTRQALEDQATFGLQKGEKPEGAGEAPEVKKEKGPVESLAALSTRPASRRPGAKKPDPAAADSGNSTRVLNVADVEGSGGSPRDLIWDLLTAQGDAWSTVDQVSAKTKLSKAEAQDELGALVQEGYVKQAKDSSGKAVYRIIEA